MFLVKTFPMSLIENNRFGVIRDGEEHLTEITPKMKRKAATTITYGGGAATGLAATGLGSAIASLGSIGIAGLGTAISLPLFPVLGAVAGVAAAGAGLAAVVSAAESIDPSPQPVNRAYPEGTFVPSWTDDC